VVDILRREGSVRNLEIRYRIRSGEVRLLLFSAELILLEHEECVLSLARDITELRSLEDQLRQAQKMEAVGRLAGGLAHDLNNLMTVVTGYAELFLMETGEEDPRRAEIKEIRGAGERAAKLVGQLLAFSRKQVLQPMVLDLNDVVEGMEGMLRRLIGEDIETRCALAPDLWRIHADPSQLEQVILNLAVNARDAMPGGGKLTIETANKVLDGAYARRHIGMEPGNYVMLVVSDTGVGMDAETRERVFEPFFTTKTKAKGTGLGLSVVYGIVKQSHGHIWVYSEPGKGSVFKIYLPRMKATESEAEETRRTPGPVQIPRGRETILLVEDEGLVLGLAERILRGQGYLVVAAQSAADALTACQTHPESIDLLLTDVVMPGEGGKALAARLQEIHPQMKVLYMSGYADDAIVHHGALEPGAHFLQKPFTPEGLARKVREVLDSLS
jgi:signal transduction histidine kinase/CheY-like chemotaxis protein